MSFIRNSLAIGMVATVGGGLATQLLHWRPFADNDAHIVADKIAADPSLCRAPLSDTESRYMKNVPGSTGVFRLTPDDKDKINTSRLGAKKIVMIAGPCTIYPVSGDKYHIKAAIYERANEAAFDTATQFRGKNDFGDSGAVPIYTSTYTIPKATFKVPLNKPAP